MLAVFLELRDQRREIAVARDDHERIDVLLAPGQVHGVDDQANVRGVLAGHGAAWNLDQLDTALVQDAGVRLESVPVRVGHLRQDFSLFEQSIEHTLNLELRASLESERDVLEVDEDSEVGFHGPFSRIGGLPPAGTSSKQSRGRVADRALKLRNPGTQRPVTWKPREQRCIRNRERFMSEFRQFDGSSNYVADDDLNAVVNAAVLLRRPLLVKGEPGTGKTLSASMLPLLLPDLSDDERLQIQIIRDIAGLTPTDERPFRAPHHSASLAGLIGGTSRALPGEITLAHCGVLFLDELPEFKREVLETLRQPLESGEVAVVRAGVTHSYPARFQLIAAMNPCPCGYLTSTTTNCRCSSAAIQRYQSRLSGPLMDRFDLHATLNRVDTALILKKHGEPLNIHALQQEIAQARSQQLKRQGVLNAELPGNTLEAICQLEDSDLDWLAKAANRLKLSARTLHRSMRVARTIADLSGETTVSRGPLAEALSFRPASNSGA